MAITFQNNSPGRDPMLIHRSLTTLIRGDLCYSIELHIVAQPGRCPGVGKLPLQSVVDPTESVNPPSRKSASPTTAAPPGADDAADALRENTNHDSSQSQPAAMVKSSVSKRAKVLELITRSAGATLSEIEAITGWQAHSIRALVSALAKREHIQIRSSKNQAGELVYRIENLIPPHSSP